MFDKFMRSVAATLKNLLLVVGSNAPGHTASPAPSQGSTIVEVEPGDGPSWGTLSGLTAHPSDATRLYAITDHDSAPIRILEIAIEPGAARVVRQIAVTTPGLDELDTEAIVAKPEGGFWLASEGAKHDSPPNLLLEVDTDGQVTRTIGLPEFMRDRMPKKGIEGIAVADTAVGRHLVVAFQAPIKKDDDDIARIADINLATGEWRFYGYPLDAVPDGDVTGLSEIVHVRDRQFAVIERDGNSGRDAIKRIMVVDLGSAAGTLDDDELPILRKQLAVDLVPLFLTGGRDVEKEVEGLAIAADGQVYAITDNDNERPTLLLRLGPSSSLFQR